MDLDNFTIRQHGEPVIYVKDIPYQHLRPAIDDIAVRPRSIAAADTRPCWKDLREVDRDTYRVAVNKLNTEQQRITTYLSTGGALANDRLYDMGQSDSRACQFCGHHTQTIEHLCWKCPHPDLVAARIKVHPKELDLSQLDPDDLPNSLLIGVPPIMATGVYGTYWGAIRPRSTLLTPSADSI